MVIFLIKPSHSHLAVEINSIIFYFKIYKHYLIFNYFVNKNNLLLDHELVPINTELDGVIFEQLS